MKLSHLSIAIFSAIALAACGGSSSSKSPTEDTPPPPPPKPKPVVPVTPTTGQEIIDPTQTGVVGELNLAEQASKGTTQYIRGEKSKFDRVDNPDDKASSTAILGVNLKEQNPQLSNIVLARLPDPNNGNVYVQLAGNWDYNSADIWNPKSLQMQNELNVKLLDNPPTVAATTLVANLKTRLGIFEGYKSIYEDANDGISSVAAAQQPKARQQYAEILAHIATLEDMIDSLESDPEFGSKVVPLVSYISDNGSDYFYRWGDDVRTAATNLGDSGVNTAAPGTNPEANGLVAMNFQKQGETTKVDRVSVQGTEEKSQSSTRIFGRNFNTLDAVTMKKTYSAVNNSYLGAGVRVLDAAGNNLAAAAADTTNSIPQYEQWKDDAYGDSTTLADNVKVADQVGYTLGVVPMNLNKVQYGRVTAKLDPPAITKVDKPIVYNREQFRTKGNSGAVDTYFYRGVDATTLDQMNDIKKSKLNYRGHALMYGVSNNFIGKLGGNVPNAVGSGGRSGIGNFVSAEVDLSDKTIRGGIYNVWQQGTGADTVEDVIVSFSGKIHGNTALGEAERVYKAGKADFRASFFGANAEELGGSINSITYQQKYGPEAGQDVWGGAFGAKNVAGGLSNKWLGDIPKVK